MAISEHLHFNRSRAKEAGKTRYFTEKQCPYGHASERMVSNGRCCDCMKEYKKSNIKDANEKQKIDRKKNPEKWRSWRRAGYYKNLEKNRNTAKLRARKKASLKPKIQVIYRNPAMRNVANRMRCRMWSYLKSEGKGQKPRGISWQKIVGYSVTDLKIHIEKQFLKGMNWDNSGKWEIDHILPLSSFEFSSFDDISFKFAWSLPNLRPIWKIDNREKGSRRLHLI